MQEESKLARIQIHKVHLIVFGNEMKNKDTNLIKGHIFRTTVAPHRKIQLEFKVF